MMNRVFLRKWIDRLSIIKQYFLRGHNAWFALFFSIINFTLIFYNLLFEKLFFIPAYLKSYLIFFIIFGILYFPLATIIGFLDFKKGTYSAEASLQKEVNPVTREIFARFAKLEQDNQKILELLDKLEQDQ